MSGVWTCLSGTNRSVICWSKGSNKSILKEMKSNGGSTNPCGFTLEQWLTKAFIHFDYV